MVETESIIIILILFIACAVLTVLLISYYNKYTSSENDKLMKYVVLRDLEGHKKKIGIFRGFGAKEQYYSIIVLNNLGQEEEWLIEIERKFTLGAPTIDYGRDEYVILCDFYKSKFPDRIITPLIDLEILKMGLTGGIRAIREETNPLYLQIDDLKRLVEERDHLIQQKDLEHYSSSLKFIKTVGVGNSNLLDQIKMEYLIANYIANLKISEKRKNELKGELDSITQSIKTAEKKAEEMIGSASKAEEYPKKSSKTEATE
jgi:hypothetical protein